jgi:23S rRNA (cytosine1962-C5)-methyltransferase
MQRITLTTPPTGDYALIDSGEEQKLERYGDVVLARPDPQALWPKRLGEDEWAKAQGRFVRQSGEGKWLHKDLPKQWDIKFGELQFHIKPTSFKHTGLFPEQYSNWQWATERIKGAGRDVKVLNLFGYTGGATLAAAAAGAEVTHVDASKTAVQWASDNAKLSRLGDKPIRWIIEDALVFLRREVKRGNKYDGIIMDPPSFGHGPKDELWKFEEHFLELMKLCQEVLSDQPIFFLINGYAAGYSPLAFAYNLDSIQKKFGGEVEFGDLTIAEQNSDRVLPCGIFARWRLDR